VDEQLEFIKQIASRLDSVGIPYMLTGSIAMAIYSTPRMTRDIDLIVEIRKIEVDKIAALFNNDCYIDSQTVRQAVQDQGMFNIIHNDWQIKADFIIRKNEPYRVEEFSRRRGILIEETMISVVAPEDLILSKLLWAKDSLSTIQLQDVKQLLSDVAELDWNYLNKWALSLGIYKRLVEARKDE
jgi:hypothetical protein